MFLQIMSSIDFNMKPLFFLRQARHVRPEGQGQVGGVEQEGGNLQGGRTEGIHREGGSPDRIHRTPISNHKAQAFTD